MVQAGKKHLVAMAREGSLSGTSWKAHIPHKVRIFAWRAATDFVPTKENKMKRTLEHDSICNICGREPKDAHHATVCCTKARALREAMREVWPLPKGECFARSRPDWLLILLSQCDSISKDKILLM